ncbi:MAG: DUF1292 domain-containing protein [Firmicutes bacterium]|nr:DUF1292 domain-containing protein [Bacillota bacterium]
MEEAIIVLLDEDGKEHEFILREMLEIDGQAYALLSLEEVPDEVVVLRMAKDEDGEDVYMVIEDDEEFDLVQEVLESLD